MLFLSPRNDFLPMSNVENPGCSFAPSLKSQKFSFHFWVLRCVSDFNFFNNFQYHQSHHEYTPLNRALIRTGFFVALRDHALAYSDLTIPQITDDYNSLADVGWYGSAYLLTCCSFQLLFGKLYTLYSVKKRLSYQYPII